MSNIFIVPQGIKTTPSILGIGFTDEIAHSCYGPCKRAGFTVHFNTKGKGFFNEAPVCEGEGFLVPDGMYARHFADKSDPWQLLWITFDERSAESQEILREYNANPKTGIFRYHFLLHVQKAVKQLKETNGISMSSLRLLELYLSIHCNCIAPFSDKNRSSNVYLDYAISYIKSNLHRQIRVKELTDRIGITQPYLYQLFMEKFSMSPKQYILYTKIEVAKDLLLHTELSITEIANSVGYPDILTFSRLFSTKEHVSPTKYRLQGV